MAEEIENLARYTRCGHATGVQASLDKADAKCKALGLNMTSGRRKVLSVLLQEHRALSAYEILELISLENGHAKPPIAYRALNFLTEHGFAHRIERLNAYVACTHPEENHAPAFMICRVCHAVDEAHMNPAKSALAAVAREKGFQIERTTFEAEGICPCCADAAQT